MNVCPPPLVETYGRETLLSAPAWRTEEGDDGAVLVVAYEDPLSLSPVGDLVAHSASMTPASEPAPRADPVSRANLLDGVLGRTTRVS